MGGQPPECDSSSPTSYEREEANTTHNSLYTLKPSYVPLLLRMLLERRLLSLERRHFLPALRRVLALLATVRRLRRRRLLLLLLHHLRRTRATRERALGASARTNFVRR